MIDFVLRKGAQFPLIDITVTNQGITMIKILSVDNINRSLPVLIFNTQYLYNQIAKHVTKFTTPILCFK